MKRLFTFLLSIVCFSALFGQTDVYLNLNHKLGAKPFAFNTAAQNNLGNDFNVSRLQYYISEIVIIHDGGIEDTVPNLWILANAAATTNELLGNYSITTLEGVRFGIGVNQDVNHDDPSGWSFTHPLAPKSPSMHWGWTAGYRFVAMEGKGGSQLNQVYQIHALGDGNYGYATVSTSGTTSGNDLIIDIDADYEMALQGINVSNGLINHGETGTAQTLLNNFQSSVFSPASTVGVEETLSSIGFSLAPNPTANRTQLVLTGHESLETNVLLTDLTGKVLMDQPVPASGEMEIEMPKGFYIVSILNNGQKLASQKLLVTE